jgi:hypothetical protein
LIVASHVYKDDAWASCVTLESAFFRNLLVFGAMFWLLFAFVAWTADGVEVSPREILVGRALPLQRTHAIWEDRARLEAIRARAAEHTGESHFAN